MKNPRISIIMPIYNAAPYLAQAIDSVLNQSYKDIELILVNDGSTDGSDDIIKKYAQSDSRVIDIHKRNAGVFRAREDGLAIAHSEYVMFMDSDDWYEDGLFQKIIDIIDKNQTVNIIEFKFYQTINGIQKPADYLTRSVSNAFYNIKNEDIMAMTGVVNKCYRLEFIKKYQLKGVPDSSSSAEIPFHIVSFLLAKEIYFLDFYGYNWRFVENSISHNKHKTERFLSNIWKVLDFLESEMKRLNVYDRDQYHAYCTTILGWFINEKFSFSKHYYTYYTTCRRLFKKWGTRKMKPYWLFVWRQLKKKICPR